MSAPTTVNDSDGICDRCQCVVNALEGRRRSKGYKKVMVVMCRPCDDARVQRARELDRQGLGSVRNVDRTRVLGVKR